MKRRLKELAKRALRPLLDRVDARVDSRVDTRLAVGWGAGEPGDLTAAIDEVRRGIDKLDGQLAPVLETIATRNAADREIARALDDLRADITRLESKIGPDVGPGADG